MDYLIHYGNRDKDSRSGTQKLFQTGDIEAHNRIVESLLSGEKIKWNDEPADVPQLIK